MAPVWRSASVPGSSNKHTENPETLGLEMAGALRQGEATSAHQALVAVLRGRSSVQICAVPLCDTAPGTPQHLGQGVCSWLSLEGREQAQLRSAQESVVCQTWIHL